MDEDGQEVTCASWQVWGVQHRTVGALGRAADNAEWTQQGVQCLETGLRLLCRELTPSAGEQCRRAAVVQRVQAALGSTGTATPFGSCVAELHLPGADVDISLESWLEWRRHGKEQHGHANHVGRKKKAQVLAYAAQQLHSAGVCQGRVQRVPWAHNPLLRFTDAASGLACDVCVGSRAPLARSALLGQLAQLDWRVGALVRLVKAWAAQADISGAARGRLSSYALTLMCVWHLQMRQPAVLPPLGALFGWRQRPAEGGAHFGLGRVRGSGVRLRDMRAEGAFQPANAETLCELLLSFFATWHATLRAWLQLDEPSRCLRASVWEGCYRLVQAGWSQQGTIFSIEDPLDSTDNVARAVRSQSAAQHIVAAFERAGKAMRDLRGRGDAEWLLQELFGCKLADERLLRQLNKPAQPPVPTPDMTVPPCLKPHVNAKLSPTPVTVQHKQPRGVPRRAEWDESKERRG